METTLQHFKNWQSNNDLTQIAQNDRPKVLIEQWSESLLSTFSGSLLVENYDVYQILMDYWANTMQDDVYLIAGEGWALNGKLLREIIVKKDKDGKKQKTEPHDLLINKIKYKAELIPPHLIAKRFFADDVANLNRLQSELGNASQALETFLEEHSTENSLLANAFDDKDKITVKSLKSAEKQADNDEKQAIKTALKLFENEKKAKDALKVATEKLDLAIFTQYGKLSIDDIKLLVVQDKWLANLERELTAQMERAIQTLISRLHTLEQRYHSPLSALTDEVVHWENKVNQHLKTMGLI
ncbi:MULTISPECIES: hypothetical protein [unclassified Mannheimia]|uniref:hypothetical protein n=1 Tax=unclassified Mannheimia TaxID=2645054 RepID=UPI00359D44FE